MSRQQKADRIRNTARQHRYLAKGIVMLPTLLEERKAKKKGGEKNG